MDALARQNLAVVEQSFELGRVTVFDVLTGFLPSDGGQVLLGGDGTDEACGRGGKDEEGGKGGESADDQRRKAEHSLPGLVAKLIQPL